MSSYFKAVVLFTLYAGGYPWFASRCYSLLPEVRGRWVIEEAAALLVVILILLVLDPRVVRSALRSSGRTPRGAGASLALQSIFLLGLLALALRLLDPGFDDQEFAQRGLSSPAALGELFAMLPFGVVAEELIFRSCQRRLRSALGPAAGLMAVSLAFSLYHRVPGTALDRHELESLAATFAGGIVLAAAYERSASLSLLIAIHLVYDGLAVAQGWLNSQRLHIAEAALFLVWIGLSGLLVWRGRPRRGAAQGAMPSLVWEDTETISERMSPPSAWAAALLFGGAIPVLLVWVRLRLEF